MRERDHFHFMELGLLQGEIPDVAFVHVALVDVREIYTVNFYLNHLLPEPEACHVMRLNMYNDET